MSLKDAMLVRERRGSVCSSSSSSSSLAGRFYCYCIIASVTRYGRPWIIAVCAFAARVALYCSLNYPLLIFVVVSHLLRDVHTTNFLFQQTWHSRISSAGILADVFVRVRCLLNYLILLAQRAQNVDPVISIFYRVRSICSISPIHFTRTWLRYVRVFAVTIPSVVCLSSVV